MKVLLHVCCGVCAAGAVERLVTEGHDVKGYFYNPNIFPADEYAKRLEAAATVSRKMEFELIEGPVNTDDWLEATQHMKDEPEGGKRCEICFRFRLEQANKYLAESGCDVFATTLTISPHKSAELISNIGKEIGSNKYLEMDFKKKAGFQRANELSNELGIYRQNYCGCVYSQRAVDTHQ